MGSHLLVPVAAFRTPYGFVRDSRCHYLARLGYRDIHVLDICVPRVLHMLVEVPRHLPLHVLVEGWLRTLLVTALLASQTVARTFGRSGRTQPVVALLGRVDVLAAPLASLGLVVVVLGGLWALAVTACLPTLGGVSSPHRGHVVVDRQCVPVV